MESSGWSYAQQDEKSAGINYVNYPSESYSWSSFTNLYTILLKKKKMLDRPLDPSSEIHCNTSMYKYFLPVAEVASADRGSTDRSFFLPGPQ